MPPTDVYFSVKGLWHGSAWLTMAHRGSPWLTMAWRGSPWLTVARRGSAWLAMARRGSPWFNVAQSGCVAHGSSAWLSMARVTHCGSAGLFWGLVSPFLMPALLKVGVFQRCSDSAPLPGTLLSFLSFLPLSFIQSRAGDQDQSWWMSMRVSVEGQGHVGMCGMMMQAARVSPGTQAGGHPI